MDISIIICTYNPEERVFSRCLAAIRQLKRDGLAAEVLLIDNNSEVPLTEVGYISDFLSGCTGAKYIREPKAGLTYARICGYTNSVAPLIIFFDDDNEPEENYLLVVKDTFLSRPDVGMIGPGKIEVDFIDGSSPWLETKRPIFQQRNMTAAAYGNDMSYYKEYYPFGTGLSLRRPVMEQYYAVMKASGEISDRKGSSLISGGDTQIVWTGIKLGYLAGSTPLLQVNHLVPGSRTSEAYIKKLHYSLSYSDCKTYLGVFPEKEQEIRKRKRLLLSFSFILTKCIIRNIFNRKLLLTQLAPSFLGKTAGYYYAFNEKKPGWLKATEKLFGVNYYS